MKSVFIVLLSLASLVVSAKGKSNSPKSSPHREYHVSVKGSDKGDGSLSRPFKTIMAAANLAMPGDVITVHAGVYREKIVPPRGGNSEVKRITYQAAKGEKVEIKGSELITGWKKLENDTWEVKIPNSFFGTFNPYNDLIRGDWFLPTPKERKYHTGAVYLNGDWLMEAASQQEVMKAATRKISYGGPVWILSRPPFGRNSKTWIQTKKPLRSMRGKPFFIPTSLLSISLR